MKNVWKSVIWKKRYLIIALILTLDIFGSATSDAVKLTQAGVRLGRLGTSATTNNDVLITFKLNTTPTSVAKIKITFPTGFTITTGTPTVATTGFPNTPGSITAPPGTLSTAVTGAGAGAGGTIVVSGLTSASLTGTSLYGFIVPTGSIANPASTGQYNITVESDNSSNAAIDTSTTPISIVSTANGDQLSVNASVLPSFSFSLSGNSDTVPKADPSAIQTSTGVSMLVSTNSPLGYTAYVKSSNNALTSATSSGTPISTGTFDGTADTVAAGTTKYGFVPATGTACTTCTGAITYDGEYAVADAAHAGAFNGANVFSSFMSRSGYTNQDTIVLKERVAVSSTVGYATDYTDTLTIVAAGNF